ncbi:MAG: hypothetical protein FWC76_07105 [Defluviitaleaceae bacterium]|nr:hypothetical protein [Defluviitaleaceae bacterium]
MPKTKKRGNAGFVILILFVLLVLCAIALVAFDAFGLRSNIMSPQPIVAAPPYEAIARAESVTISGLQEDLDYHIAANAALQEQIDHIERENTRLRELEALHIQFQQYRDEFYRDLAYENPDAFINFFTSTSPALADEIFRSLASAQAAEEEWQNYLAVWGAMNPLQVALIIEDMLTTHMPLIVRVMSELPDAHRSMVFNNLSAESAGIILRQMEP